MREQWSPIEDMPTDAIKWWDPGYQEALSQWRNLRPQLESTKLDKKIMDIWAEERQRRFAIETGQIEGLYVIPRGITEQLITEGLESVRLSHKMASPEVEDDSLTGLLKDQKTALEMVFDTVAQRRSLSHTAFKEWHQLLTRYQATAASRTLGGKRVGIPLLKGEYKLRPNNPRRPDGVVHQYCPPEQVRSELDRLLDMYAKIHEQSYATEVEAAWLHHRYIQIHPFQDGNGRTARLLMAYAYIRRGEFPPMITAAEKPPYIAALELADAGDLRPFAERLAILASESLNAAVIITKQVLKSSRYYAHSNGDCTYKAPGENEWKRGPDEDNGLDM
ncbi:Fic family protein [Candidatus Spongiihabitans sp.]|uniref:Fic family protein n=1 Tax=Candidatus Spongiihabitans sp. TaxID=3101308 RepID=UPI003C6FA474